ncbi:HupE/UreJ family protein [Lewinella sp. IMCC34183]|uniref:HupE/UreJ family protein n=1 Tax=Lewinella sp. IMCC34183 TaxID=2248762 RepID=UPI000E262145|nr:HupE/UreJ family protein [Lewinella sp. IMCC34183]
MYTLIFDSLLRKFRPAPGTCFTLAIAVLFGAALLVPHTARAHVANQSYVYFRVLQDSINGTIQVTTDDLNEALDLDLARGITKEELAPYLPRIRAYLDERFAVDSRYGNHPVSWTDQVKTFAIRDGHVIAQDFILGNMGEVPVKLDVRFNPIFDVDETHRTFALVQYNWLAGVHNNEAQISLRFGPGDAGPKELDLSDTSVWKGFRAMTVSGMYHIYIGLDHILFLIALLLPAVVTRREPRAAVGAAGSVALGGSSAWAGSIWQPVDRFKPALFYVLKIVTFFTIAHTITLSLSALGLVELPGYLVESLIALSIALAAAHNLRPLFHNDGVIIAFVFGLFHGFGFASVLREVGLQNEFMTLSLLGFNLGVELAQVLIILLLFPVLYLLRRTAFYRYLLIGGSVLLIVIALYWFIERFFDVDIPVVTLIRQLLG